MKEITPKQREILAHMWAARFARSMTLTDFSRQTISALEQSGLIAWDHEADSKPGAGRWPMYGLTSYGISFCKREFVGAKA
jgi:hypothetical protein